MPICTSALELTGIGVVLFLLVSTDVGAIFFIYGKKIKEIGIDYFLHLVNALAFTIVLLCGGHCGS